MNRWHWTLLAANAALASLGIWEARNWREVEERSCVAERDSFVKYLDSSLTMARHVCEEYERRYKNCVGVEFTSAEVEW